MSLFRRPLTSYTHSSNVPIGELGTYVTQEVSPYVANFLRLTHPKFEADSQICICRACACENKIVLFSNREPWTHHAAGHRDAPLAPDDKILRLLQLTLPPNPPMPVFQPTPSTSRVCDCISALKSECRERLRFCPNAPPADWSCVAICLACVKKGIVKYVLGGSGAANTERTTHANTHLTDLKASELEVYNLLFSFRPNIDTASISQLTLGQFACQVLWPAGLVTWKNKYIIPTPGLAEDKFRLMFPNEKRSLSEIFHSFGLVMHGFVLPADLVETTRDAARMETITHAASCTLTAERCRAPFCEQTKTHLVHTRNCRNDKCEPCKEIKKLIGLHRGACRRDPCDVCDCIYSAKRARVVDDDDDMPPLVSDSPPATPKDEPNGFGPDAESEAEMVDPQAEPEPKDLLQTKESLLQTKAEIDAVFAPEPESKALLQTKAEVDELKKAELDAVFSYEPEEQAWVRAQAEAEAQAWAQAEDEAASVVAEAKGEARTFESLDAWRATELRKLRRELGPQSGSRVYLKDVEPGDVLYVTGREGSMHFVVQEKHPRAWYLTSEKRIFPLADFKAHLVARAGVPVSQDQVHAVASIASLDAKGDITYLHELKLGMRVWIRTPGGWLDRKVAALDEDFIEMETNEGERFRANTFEGVL